MQWFIDTECIDFNEIMAAIMSVDVSRHGVRSTQRQWNHGCRRLLHKVYNHGFKGFCSNAFMAVDVSVQGNLTRCAKHPTSMSSWLQSLLQTKIDFKKFPRGSRGVRIFFGIAVHRVTRNLVIRILKHAILSIPQNSTVRDYFWILKHVILYMLKYSS